MFDTIYAPPRALAQYRAVAGERACQEVAEMGRGLRGLRVLHLSVLGEGTRTARLLSALVPLLNAVGVAAEWQIMPAPVECRAGVEALYRALAHGQKVWSAAAHAAWLRYATLNAALFDREYDFVVVHDPQPVALLSAKAARDGGRPAGRWVWHCHLDLAAASPQAWGALRPHLVNYDAAIYPAHEYIAADAGTRRVVVIPPVVDPLGPRLVKPDADDAHQVLRRYALDPRRPIVCQVGPITRATDPIGLLDAFALVRPQARGAQLVLAADVLGKERHERAFFSLVGERARQDEDVRLLSPENGVGEAEIGVLGWATTVAVQRAVGRGLSPWVAEAMWRARPVVAGRDAGLALQVADGKTGYLADSTEAFGRRLLDLLRDDGARAAMGAVGRERVRRGLLVTRCLRDYLSLFQSYC